MSARYEESDGRWAIAPMVVGAILISMVWFRYAGRWAEVDTSVLTRATRATLAEGTIEPREGVYLNGFTYPSLVGFLSRISGVSVQTVQTMLLPFCYISMGLIIFIVFRAIIGNGKLASIAACLLLIQADFLFVNQRGSHEKVTWAVVLTLVFALVTSYRQRQFSYLAPLVVVFYISGFALISTNAFFASSLITSFILSFVGGTLLIRWLLRDRGTRPFFRRLGYVFITLSVLSYLYIVYIFPPVRANLANLEGVFDRVSALYLDVEASITQPQTSTEPPAGSNEPPPPPQDDPEDVISDAVSAPYRTIASAWTNPSVFFALTSLTWLLIALAAVAWSISLFRFLRRGAPRDAVPLFLVWILAGATGFQIVSSIVADASGALGANMQLRLFPSFTLFVIPLVVATLRVPPRIWNHGHVAQIGTVIAAVAFGLFTVAAYFKATNDPVFSNKWVFYSASEEATIEWADTNLKTLRIWGEFDERLLVASVLLADDDDGAVPDGALWITGSGPNTATRFVLISDVTEKHAIRIRGAMPDTRGTDRLYDNGEVQIFHKFPETPYAP